MDIVYILGTGSKHDNIELRMSLRSICKYGQNIGRVIVAGDPVDWLSDDVVKIKIPVKYIGLGEQMTDLQCFNREEFVKSLIL